MRTLSCVWLVIASACESPWQSWPDRQQVDIIVRQPAMDPRPPTDRLRIMTWNLKFAGARIDFWFDFWGDRVHMTHGEATENLGHIVALIRELDPDILLAQEIEVNSYRSGYIDMVDEILHRAGFSHAAYFSTWKSRYVPSEGLGRVDMGNAIFSRFPIREAERISLSDRSDLDGITQAFYLHRALGRAQIAIGERQVTAMVVHTEAYDTDETKSRQLIEVLAHSEEVTGPFVLGGDFNAIPPGTVDVSGFNDEHPAAIGTEFAQPPYDLTDMEPFYRTMRSAIPLERYGTTLESQHLHFTHSVIGHDRVGSRDQLGFWNRTLDYLFVDAASGWVKDSTDTLQTPGRMGITLDPMALSDHCPVIGTWQLGSAAP